ncbi:MAG: Slp family lipoprotein [Deltaproteobacteria bacterium]|nr:Slp family lipoprotein [Deltaproteobacteria bacterium]
MKNLTLVPVLLILLLASGCGSVLTKELVKDIDRNITIESVQADPERYIGKKVVWGGIVLATSNLEATTEVEVLETTLSFDDRPENGSSRGRFIIEAKKYLDANVYKEEKRITVAGVVSRVETRKIGQMDYPFPVITPIEMKLFDKMEPYAPDYYSQPYYPYYGPYSPYYPFNPYGPTYPYGPNPNRYPYPYPYYPYP